MLFIDGKTLKKRHNAFGKYTNGSVSDLLKLPDILLAVTVEGKGFYILTQDGQFRFAVETSDYKYISNMASNKSGVVWLELGMNRIGRVWFGNGGIHTQVFDEFPWKVLHGSTLAPSATQLF